MHERCKHIDPIEAAERAGVVIRAVRTDDAEALADVMGQPGVIAGTLQVPFTPVASRETSIQRSLDDADSTFLSAVTVGDGRLVGSLGIHTNSRRPRRRHIASIGMSVHDEWHGRGVGTALMAAAVDQCDRWLQVRRIELECHVGNPAAQRLYEKFGFDVEGTLRDYSFTDGAYTDALVMSRIRPVG